jgi:hypothetical protein
VPPTPEPTGDKRSRRAGLDAYELAILRGPTSLQGDPEAANDQGPLPKLRFGNLRVGSIGLLVGVFVIFMVGNGVRLGGANHTPKLKTSCTTPALAISTASVVRGQPLYYAVTGPDRDVVVAIDAARLSPDLTATALPGKSQAQVVRPPARIRGCKGKGILGVQAPPGAHTVSVFPAAGGDPLASKPLSVSDR